MQTTNDRNAAAACPAARGPAPPAREDGPPTRHPTLKAPGPPPPGGRGLPGLPPPRLSSLRWKAPPPNARNKAKPYSSHGRHSWKAPGPGEVRGRAETAEEKRARGVPVHVIKRNARRAAPRKRRNMPPPVPVGGSSRRLRGRRGLPGSARCRRRRRRRSGGRRGLFGSAPRRRRTSRGSGSQSEEGFRGSRSRGLPGGAPRRRRRRRSSRGNGSL